MSAAPRLLSALADLQGRHPLDRKILVARTAGAGREVLRRLAREGGGWMGFEVMTPAPLAARIGRDSLERQGRHPTDTFETQALLDEALDAALRGVEAALAELSEGLGFRQRMHEAVTALRLAGVTPQRLRQGRLSDPAKQGLLIRMLERYERLLHERRRADLADVFLAALEVLEREGARLPSSLGCDGVWLEPGLSTRGLAGRLLTELLRRGARVLPGDPVVGLEHPDGVLRRADADGGGPSAALSYFFQPDACPPETPSPRIRLFRAGSVTDELRHVLRLVVASGARWDDVEIITPDPAAYGSALHALSTQLGVPVTYAVGLPVERTRPGRVVRTYLEWVRAGFPADPIRRLLEAGDLRPPRSSELGRRVEAGDLARRFRSLRIGWGRERYRKQLRRALEGVERMRPGPHEAPEAFEERRDRTRAELRALRRVLVPVLRELRSVPDRVGAPARPVSPAELARGLAVFLRRVPRGRGADAEARHRIDEILERVEATLRRRTDFEAAVAILRRHLEIRVRAPSPRDDDDSPGHHSEGAPWSSREGHLHLADLEHGGHTGRRHVFFVGMDADRIPGAVLQDPVLLDSERRVLSEGLPASTEQLRERMWHLGSLLTRLGDAHLTMSYTAWEPTEARVVAPSPLLLQALRLRERDATLMYEDLRRALGPVVSRIPPEGAPPLDSDDVWLAALRSEGALRRGVDELRRAYPALDRGLAARELRLQSSGAPGAVHGVITPRPDVLDPRRNPALVVSASRMETLGTCPLRYLHAQVLRVAPPRDPRLDPDRWLDELLRGSVLHSVFERTLRRARQEGVGPADDALERVALEELAAELPRAEDEMPSPGDGVRRREISALEDDVRAFVRMIRRAPLQWVALERPFGLRGEGPVEVELPGGTIRLRGTIDRVDEDLEGLHVIDYKTGSPRRFEAKYGVFDGGRRLQIGIYAAVAERLFQRNVARGEYHFPTRRGEHRVVAYTRAQLARVPELLDLLCETAAAGTFLPTDEADDCTFCDYRAVCRVREGRNGTESPLAGWSKAALEDGRMPQVRLLRQVRRFEQ